MSAPHDPRRDFPTGLEDKELGLYGPLTGQGEKIYAAIVAAAEEERLDIGKEDVRLLGGAVEALASFNDLLASGASGDPSAIDALRARLRGRPGMGLWRELEAFGGRRPIGPPFDGPCLVGGPDFGAIVWADLHLGGGGLVPRSPALDAGRPPLSFDVKPIGEVGLLGLTEPRWPRQIDAKMLSGEGALPGRDELTRPGAWSALAMREFGSIAGPVNHVLEAGRVWLDSESAGPLHDAFGKLRGIGRGGQRDLVFPCFDEHQVCLGAMLNFAWDRLRRPSLPLLASLSPTDVCVGYQGLLSLTAGGKFPAREMAGAIFPTIDRRAADIVAWSESSILMRVPEGIEPGCHTVGWGLVNDPGAVAEMKAIGEQCMPWYHLTGFLNFPLMLWDEPLSFSVIGEPAVKFTANGIASLAVEACTPVTLSWSVTLKACTPTHAARHVSMFRDGQPFRPTLPPEGQIVVADAENARYTLRAASRIGATTCATVERTAQIQRHKLLRVAPILDRCADKHATISLNITASCPAPAGGLELTIASSDPARTLGTTAALDEGARAITVDVLAGDSCGPVALTVSAPMHAPAQTSYVVVSAPVISGLSPQSMPTCELVALTLTGDCMGDPAFPPVGVLITPTGELLEATVEVRAAQTEVRLSHSALPAGQYSAALSNCGRSSLAPVGFAVSHRLPEITGRLTADATALQLCATPTITLRWTVRYAQTARLIRDGTVLVAERTYNDLCSGAADTVADQLPTVSTGVSYQLDAINPDGITVSQSLQIAAGSVIPTRTAFAVINTRSEAMNVFLLNREDFDGTFIGQLGSGQGIVVSIPSCRVRMIASVVPRLVAQHNASFPNNQFSPTAVATARNTAGGWTGSSSGPRLGQPNAGTESLRL